MKLYVGTLGIKKMNPYTPKKIYKKLVPQLQGEEVYYRSILFLHPSRINLAEKTPDTPLRNNIPRMVM